MFVIILLVLIFLFLMFYASYSVSLGFYIKNLCFKKNANNAIAITFDDGIDPVKTPIVLDILQKYGVKATFFIIGQKAQKYPDILKDILQRGHEIGNHSYYHKWNFPLQTQAKIMEEIQACSSTIKHITGFEPKLFRPPFGITNPQLARAIKKLKLTSVAWSLRSLDTTISAENVKLKISKNLKSGTVILLHDDRENIADILEFLLQYAKQNKLKPLTISELFELA